MDTAHAEISQQILETADRFDGFFGDERLDEERQNTQISLKLSSVFQQGTAPAFSIPVGIKLSLPRLENRVQLAVDTLLQEGEDQDEAGEPDADIRVSLRYKMLEQLGKWIRADGGVKMNFGTIGMHTLEPFGALRFRSAFDFDPWAIRVTQLTNWHEQSGWSGLSRVEFERHAGRNTFSRISGKTEYAEAFSGYTYAFTWFLRHQLSHNRAIGLQFHSEGRTHPHIQTDMNEVRFTYRRRIYKEWAFLTILPTARLTREENFEMRPLLRVELELYFGRIGT